MAQYVPRGGLVAFQEFQFEFTPLASAPMGLRLRQIFLDAGLSAPSLHMDGCLAPEPRRQSCSVTAHDAFSMRPAVSRRPVARPAAHPMPGEPWPRAKRERPHSCQAVNRKIFTRDACLFCNGARLDLGSLTNSRRSDSGSDAFGVNHSDVRVTDSRPWRLREHTPADAAHSWRRSPSAGLHQDSDERRRRSACSLTRACSASFTEMAGAGARMAR